MAGHATLGPAKAASEWIGIAFYLVLLVEQRKVVGGKVSAGWDLDLPRAPRCQPWACCDVISETFSSQITTGDASRLVKVMHSPHSRGRL
jgi:hypothetical protein